MLAAALRVVAVSGLCHRASEELGNKDKSSSNAVGRRPFASTAVATDGGGALPINMAGQGRRGTNTAVYLEQAARRARAVRRGASVGHVNKTQEDPSDVCENVNNKVPSYVWKVTTQASKVERAQLHHGW